MLYQPTHFDPRDPALAWALVRTHPLATVVSSCGDDPLVSHAPMMLIEGESAQLIGHLAAQNPHAQALADGAPITAIFHGPQGYVSPSWYTVKKAVPTWNYAVVHVRGRVARVDDSEGKEDVLKALIDRHDLPYHAQWDALDLDYREGMKRGIVGFRIVVESVVAKFKLSQNRSAEDRAGVAAGQAQGDASSRALADLMRQLGLA
jgi:transcriptional regulator